MKCLLDRIHSHGIGSKALLHVLGHNKVFVPFIKVNKEGLSVFYWEVLVLHCIHKFCEVKLLRLWPK